MGSVIHTADGRCSASILSGVIMAMPTHTGYPNFSSMPWRNGTLRHPRHGFDATLKDIDYYKVLNEILVLA